MKSIVLCYNLRGTRKGKQIAMIFGFLGYKVKHVEKMDYLHPIGVLAGIMDTEQEKKESTYEGEGFPEEMLIMNAATEEMLDKALFLMRKEKVQVGLKAMITESNQNWTSLELYEEIKKEHEYMTKNAKERK